MALLERLPDPPTHTLHLTDPELYALRQALLSGVRNQDEKTNIRAAQAALFLATEKPTHHERFAALLEDADAPLPPDGERTWCTLVRGPANGSRVYVPPQDRELFMGPFLAGRKRRYVRAPDNPTQFVYTPEEDV